MSYTIYIDVLFLLNLVINHIIISSTAFIVGHEYNVRRTVIASAFGALYSTLIFFPQLQILNVLLLKIAVSIVIVLIAFKYKNRVALIKQLITYYIINFVYGGGMYAFYRFTALGSKMNFSNGEYYIDMPLWMIILLAIGFHFIIKLFGRIISSRQLSDQIIDLQININDKSINVTALIDTGNSLYDPLSSLPVMLVENNILKDVLGYNILIDAEKQQKKFAEHKMRIIPYNDAAGGSGTIFAFKPNSIKVIKTGEHLSEMLIGIVAKQLSPDMSYNALLHSNTLLKG